MARERAHPGAQGEGLVIFAAAKRSCVAFFVSFVLVACSVSPRKTCLSRAACQHGSFSPAPEITGIQPAKTWVSFKPTRDRSSPVNTKTRLSHHLMRAPASHLCPRATKPAPPDVCTPLYPGSTLIRAWLALVLRPWLRNHPFRDLLRTSCRPALCQSLSSFMVSRCPTLLYLCQRPGKAQGRPSVSLIL